jgi:hypothetical protein
VSNQPPGGFNWNLGAPVPDDEPVTPEATVPPAPVAPPAPAQPPVFPAQPSPPAPAQGMPPRPPAFSTQPPAVPAQPTAFPAPPPAFPAPPPAFPAQSRALPTQPPAPHGQQPPAGQTPLIAPPPPFQPPQYGQSPAQPGFPPAAPPPVFDDALAATEAYVFPAAQERPLFEDVPTQAMPFDSALGTPPDAFSSGGNGLPAFRETGARPAQNASGIDALFGDSAFQEYEQSALPSEGFGALVSSRPREERVPLGRTQKVLLAVAGGLVGVLALVTLFLVGTKIDLPEAAPAPANTGVAAPVAAPPPVGPIAAGGHSWSDLLGTECVDPYESAWAESYTVVDCAAPHAAQMVFRGIFDDETYAAYPGAEALQSRVNLLCTPASVIDYAAAKAYSDIQIAASYPATAEQWDAGNRNFYCFVNRSSGEPLTETVAITPVALDAPVASIPSTDP